MLSRLVLIDSYYVYNLIEYWLGQETLFYFLDHLLNLINKYGPKTVSFGVLHVLQVLNNF